MLAKIELTNNGIFGLYYKGFFDNVPNIGENVKVKGRLNKRNKIIFASKIKVQFDSPASFKNINPLIIEGHIHSSQLVQFSNNPKYQKYLCEKCRLLNDYQDVIWYQTGRKDLFIPKYRLLIEDYNKNILTCFFEPEWFLPDLTNYAECPIPPRNSGFWDSYLRRMWKQLSKQLFTRPMLGMIVPFPSILTNNLVKFQCKENTDGSYDILWLHNLTSKTVSYKSQYSNYKYHELKNIPTSSTIEGYILEEPKEVSLFQSIAPLLLNKNIELTTIYNPITGQQYVTDKGEFFEIIQQYRIVSIILQVETNNNNIVSVALDPRVNSGYYNKTKNTWENPTILSENMKIKISGHFSINGVLIGNDIQIL